MEDPTDDGRAKVASLDTPAARFAIFFFAMIAGAVAAALLVSSLGYHSPN